MIKQVLVSEDALNSIKAMAEKDAKERDMLLTAMQSIKLRAFSDTSCEELEDAQRDLRHIYAIAEKAVNSAMQTK